MEITNFHFESHEVRVVTIDGEPWFVAADVSRILGYRMASDMTRRIDDEDRGTRSMRTPSGTQEMTVISEPGLYAAVLGSQVPGARVFKRWVTHEVLPTIRRTGGYGVAAPSGRELLALAVVEAQQMLAAKDERIAELDAKVEADAPKVNYVDVFVADADLRILRDVAKSLGVQEKRLRAALLKHEWIYSERDTRWSDSEHRKVETIRYSAYAHKRDYFRPVPRHDAPRFRGELDHTLKVTPAGAEAIARAVDRWGLRGESAA